MQQLTIRSIAAAGISLLLSGCGADFWIVENDKQKNFTTIDSSQSVTFNWDSKKLGTDFVSAQIQPLGVPVGNTGPSSQVIDYSGFYYFEGTRDDGSVKNSSRQAEVVALHEYCSGGGVALNADVWIPTTAAPAEGYPAVLFIHGGSWRDRDYSDMFEFLHRAVTEGYIGMSIDYRLSDDGDTGEEFPPIGKWPNQIQDAKCAVRWLRAQQQAGELNLNPDAIGAVGVSAGGHLALLLGLTDQSDNPVAQERINTYRQTLQYQGIDDSVQAVVSMAGPTELWEGWHYLNRMKELDINVPSRDHALTGMQLMFDEPPTDDPQAAASLPYIQNSPEFFVDTETAQNQSFLMINGESDRLIPSSQSCRLAHKLWDLGGTQADATVLVYSGEDTTHYSYQNARNVSNLQKLLVANIGKRAQEVLDDTFAFLAKKLKNESGSVTYTTNPVPEAECDSQPPVL